MLPPFVAATFPKSYFHPLVQPTRLRESCVCSLLCIVLCCAATLQKLCLTHVYGSESDGTSWWPSRTQERCVSVFITGTAYRVPLTHTHAHPHTHTSPSSFLPLPPSPCTLCCPLTASRVALTSLFSCISLHCDIQFYSTQQILLYGVNFTNQAPCTTPATSNLSAALDTLPSSPMTCTRRATSWKPAVSASK